MKTQDYWKRRAEINAKAEHVKADIYTNQLTKEYRAAAQSIFRDIEAFYGRFATNNGVTMAQAKKLLDKGELNEFKMTLEGFMDKAQNNADGKWTTELNNVYYRTRISRYEALLVQIKQELEMLTGKQQVGFRGLLTGNYTDTYYRTLFDIQKGTGLGVTFARVDDRALTRVLTTDWAGSNFSKRIWANRDKLAREIQTNLSQSFIRGDDLYKTIKTLQERFDVSRSNAARLVRTESAHISAEATFDGYRESGVVKQYQFLSTLDSRTSQQCQSMDNRIFDLSDKEVGVNYPPLHANCRSTTVAYFGDEEPSERTARGNDGEVYYIPDNMSYDQWKKEYIDSPKSKKKDILRVEDKFQAIMDKTEATPEYKKALTDRFSAGSDVAKRVFTDYVLVNVIKDSQFKQGAHYSPASRVVNMDFADDINNPRGRGATYFHELGHYVDNMAAIKLKGTTYDGVSHIDLNGVQAKDFKKAIFRDVQDYMQTYAKNKGVNLRQAQFEISMILAQDDGALHSAISDIYSGVTRRKIQGLYSHSPKYWQQLPNAIEKEAFAHMFEASFDLTGKRAELMREFLPSSFTLFQKILEAI